MDRDSIFSNSVYGNYANGMTYGGYKRKELTWTNPLAPEEERSLHKGTGGISLDIPKEDMYRAKCTHRDPAGKRFTLKQNDDGSVTCLKCGAVFNVVSNVDMKQINQVIGGAIDILQTTKLAYIDMTPEVIQTYFVILPFLEIAPKLYEAAMHTLDEAMPGMGITGNSTPMDAFNSLYAAAGTMGMNPYMNMQGMGAYQYGGMMMNPNMMSQVDPAHNPMQSGGGGMMMPPVDTTATEVSSTRTAQPQEGQPVQVGRKFKLD